MQQLFPALIAADRAAWLELLQREGIRSEANLDAVYGIYSDDGALIATGARYRNISVKPTEAARNAAYSIPTYGDSIYGDDGFGDYTGASVPLDGAY